MWNQSQTEHYLSWHDTIPVFVVKPTVTSTLSQGVQRKEDEEIPFRWNNILCYLLQWRRCFRKVGHAQTASSTQIISPFSPLAVSVSTFNLELPTWMAWKGWHECFHREVKRGWVDTPTVRQKLGLSLFLWNSKFRSKMEKNCNIPTVMTCLNSKCSLQAQQTVWRSRELDIMIVLLPYMWTKLVMLCCLLWKWRTLASKAVLSRRSQHQRIWEAVCGKY